jgi:hypothetical protein
MGVRVLHQHANVVTAHVVGTISTPALEQCLLYPLRVC